MSESVFADKAIDFSTQVMSHGTYRYSRVYPLENDDPTLDSSTQDLIYDLPTASKACNLEKSSFSFELVVATVGDGTSSSVLHNFGCPVIDGIEIYTRNGQSIASIDQFNDVSRGLMGYLTPVDEYLSNPVGLGHPTTATPDRSEFCQPSHSAVLATMALGNTNSGVRPAVVPEVANIPFLEPQYLLASTKNGAIRLKCNIPFRKIYHSIASVNQDLFLGENIYVRVRLAPKIRIGYVAAAITADMAESADIASAVQIMNPEIRLCTETNPEIVSALTARARSGYTMRVPFMRVHTKSVTGASSFDHSIRINRRDGSRLLNIYSMLYNANKTGIIAQDLDNRLATRKITDFHSKMNENRLQEFTVDITDGQDYEILRNQGLLKKSIISNNNIYNFNRVWCDSWRQGSMDEWLGNDQNVDGYPLEEEAIYSMNGTISAGSHQHMLVVVTQKDLHIGSNGLSIV